MFGYELEQRLVSSLILFGQTIKIIINYTFSKFKCIVLKVYSIAISYFYRCLHGQFFLELFHSQSISTLKWFNLDKY